MREDEYLQTLHFNNLLGQGLYSQSVPIVLSISDELKKTLEQNGERNVALYYEEKMIAYMTDIEVFPHRKEERCSRQFGTSHEGHPYIAMIKKSGDWLLGGDLNVSTSLCILIIIFNVEGW